jgi:hypothetical protein
MDPEVKEALEERDQVLRARGFPDDPQWGNFINGKLCHFSRDDDPEMPAGCLPQVGIIAAVTL